MKSVSDQESDATKLERFQFLMAGTSDGLWDWNLETDEVYYSSRWYAMLGYEPNAFPATIDTWKNLVHEDDRDWVLKAAADYLNGQIQTFNPEMRMRHKDGHDIIVLSRAKKVLSEVTGKPIRLIGSHVDITQRKNIEHQLAEKEQSYRGVLNSLNEAVYILDETGHFLDVNDGAVRMYGFPLSYFIGKTPADLAAPERNDLDAIVSKLALAFNGKEQSAEFWALRSDQTPFPKLVHMYPGVYFGQQVVIAVARDISEQKKADAFLTQQLEFRGQLLEQAAEGIVLWVLSHDDKFVRFDVWNREMQEIIGYTQAEMNTLGWLETIYPDVEQRAKAKETMLKVINGITNKGTDFEIVSKSGETKQLFIHSKAIQTENKEPAVLAIIQDVTEQKLLEETLRHSQKMEAVGTLVGGIAHDFNNMLGALQGIYTWPNKQCKQTLMP